MSFFAWIDFVLFLLLLVLFIYLFVSVTITSLHKMYLTFHLFMMIWPFCQFAIQTTDNPILQLFFVKLAFVDTALLVSGWLAFTIFLTGQSLILRGKTGLAIFIPALLVAVFVIINPGGTFVLPLQGGYVHRSYGSLFWVSMCILIGYVIGSLLIMYQTLVADKAPRIKKQVWKVLKGILVMTVFMLLDILLNVVFAKSLPIIPGLTSLGILITAFFFVKAIQNDKVFNIVNIAHQDIIDTIANGILVLDDNETVVEINQSLLPHIDLRIGDRFDMATILPQGSNVRKFELFLHNYRNHPQMNAEIEIIYPDKDRTHIHVHVTPILVMDTLVGRTIMFQDRSELRRLIEATNQQNEILQDHNQSLIVIQDELFQTNQKLEQMAITDSLTGCYNRHYMTLYLEQEVMKNMRYQIPFALFLVDMDFFKSINDTYGHLVGDEVLCSTVKTINQTMRQTDILARYGGEEFIMYLPHTSQTQAETLAERVRSAVELNKVRVENIAQSLSITISIGLLSIHNFTNINISNPKTYLIDLFNSADKALYQAKKDGRNRIVNHIASCSHSTL